MFVQKKVGVPWWLHWLKELVLSLLWLRVSPCSWNFCMPQAEPSAPPPPPPAREMKVKLHMVFFKSRLAGKTLVINPFSSRTAVAFWFVSFSVLRTWLGNHQFWGPPNVARDQGCTPFVARYGWTVLWVVPIWGSGVYCLTIAPLRGLV